MIQAVRRAWSRLARVVGSWKISETPGAVFAAPQSSAGVPVTEQDSLSLSAVFAGVNLLSRVVGSLPLTVYRRWGRAKEPALTHPAYRLLHTSPNPEMTSATFRRTLEWHRLLGGNAYASVQWAGNGKPVALWPVEPWRVRPKRRDDGSLYYELDGGKQQVEPEDMLHVPLVSSDGVCGRSFLDWAVESLGLGIATQQFAAAYFGNGARPGGILTHPGQVNDEQRKKMRSGWEERHRGPARAGGTAILWGGWTYSDDGGFDPEKSQLIEQRRFTTEEVSRWLGIPPHLLRDLSRATFSNIEQQGIDFVAYSLGPTLVDYEQEFDRKLLSPPECYCKHNVGGLLRGDSAARSAFYAQMFGIGAFSVNDILELEDRNPVDGGDVHLVPLNMAPLPQAAFPPPAAPTPAPAPQPAAPAPAPAAMRALLESTLARLAKVEARAVLRAAEKPGRFLAWLDEFYPAHQATLTEAIAPVSRACVALLGLTSGVPGPEQLAARWCLRSRETLLDLSGRVTPGQLAGCCKTLVEKTWEGRPGELAAEAIGAEVTIRCDP